MLLLESCRASEYAVFGRGRRDYPLNYLLLPDPGLGGPVVALHVVIVPVKVAVSDD